MVSRSEPGLAVSALGHASFLVAGLRALSSPNPLPEHMEAIAVEGIDPSALNQVTRGERQAERVKNPADGSHAPGAMLVRQRPDERLCEAENEVLYCDGETESLAPDADLKLDRPQKKAQGLPDAHGDGDDRRRAEDHDPRIARERRRDTRPQDASLGWSREGGGWPGAGQSSARRLGDS